MENVFRYEKWSLDYTASTSPLGSDRSVFHHHTGSMTIHVNISMPPCFCDHVIVVTFTLQCKNYYTSAMDYNQGLKLKQKCLKPALFSVASRGRFFWLQKDYIEVKRESSCTSHMICGFSNCISPEFKFSIASLQDNVHAVNYGSSKS